MSPETLEIIRKLRELGATHVVVDGVEVTFGPAAVAAPVKVEEPKGAGPADAKAALRAMEFPGL